MEIERRRQPREVHPEPVIERREESPPAREIAEPAEVSISEAQQQQEKRIFSLLCLIRERLSMPAWDVQKDKNYPKVVKNSDSDYESPADRVPQFSEVLHGPDYVDPAVELRNLIKEIELEGGRLSPAIEKQIRQMSYDVMDHILTDQKRRRLHALIAACGILLVPTLCLSLMGMIPALAMLKKDGMARSVDRTVRDIILQRQGL